MCFVLRQKVVSFCVQELIEKTREKQSATLSEVTWRERTVPVKNEQVSHLGLIGVYLHQAQTACFKLYQWNKFNLSVCDIAIADAWGKNAFT